MKDALGYVLEVGDDILHITVRGHMIVVTEREILAKDFDKNTITISPGPQSDRVGRNVRPYNCVRR